MVVAFALLAFGLTLLLGSLTNATKQVRTSTDYGRAALHAQTYGEAVDTATLIPHMLEAFMERDRGFKRLHKARSVVAPADSSDHLRRSTPT